jgi:hypothetical protein
MTTAISIAIAVVPDAASTAPDYAALCLKNRAPPVPGRNDFLYIFKGSAASLAQHERGRWGVREEGEVFETPASGRLAAVLGAGECRVRSGPSATMSE